MHSIYKITNTTNGKMYVGVTGKAIENRCVKTFLVTRPGGQQETVTNMAEYCRQNNLHRGNMCSVSKGILNHYKGFKCTLLNTSEPQCH